MKISELIEKLEAWEEAKGDIEVEIESSNDEYCPMSIENIDVEDGILVLSH